LSRYDDLHNSGITFAGVPLKAIDLYQKQVSSTLAKYSTVSWSGIEQSTTILIFWGTEHGHSAPPMIRLPWQHLHQQLATQTEDLTDEAAL